VKVRSVWSLVVVMVFSGILGPIVAASLLPPPPRPDVRKKLEALPAEGLTRLAGHVRDPRALLPEDEHLVLTFLAVAATDLGLKLEAPRFVEAPDGENADARLDWIVEGDPFELPRLLDSLNGLRTPCFVERVDAVATAPQRAKFYLDLRFMRPLQVDCAQVSQRLAAKMGPWYAGPGQEPICQLAHLRAWRLFRSRMDNAAQSRRDQVERLQRTLPAALIRLRSHGEGFRWSERKGIWSTTGAEKPEAPLKEVRAQPR
jgi:hypothetical protein